MLRHVRPRSFLQYLKTNKKVITIKIPYYDYLRGKLFVADVLEIHGDDVPPSFDVNELIFILFDDLMNQIKRGGSHSDIAAFLLAGKAKFLDRNSKVEKRQLKALSSHIFSMEDVQEEQAEETDLKFAYIQIIMKEDQLLRAEVLLHDITDDLLNGQTITVEDIFTIRFLDFIAKVKDKGNTASVQQSIKSIVYRFNE